MQPYSLCGAWRSIETIPNIDGTVIEVWLASGVQRATVVKDPATSLHSLRYANGVRRPIAFALGWRQL